MLFRQMFDSTSSTYTYLLASRVGGEALIIDPVKEQLDQYLTVIAQLDLRLVQAIDTHTHADHITALGDLRDVTQCVTIMGELSKAHCVSRHVHEDEVLGMDGIELRAIYTPGHTDESFSFVLNPKAPTAVFTGDVLLIRGSGRTDFQGGDPRRSYDSIVNKLFRLPDDTTLYPAHDYKGWTASSIGEEKKFNPRLAGKTEAEYVGIMNGLHLPNPKMMDVAIPANLACGQPSVLPKRQG
ncbi:metallo-beta-lactamase superfamily protein (plasmid) [Paraburkholderia fungorum]|jgi:sulfur dioxygenase|uniref:MBL fold metallo-hydrolase n=1 Tax=Paraburkholderia fungorum TaxID=134537 RepID=A0AAP5QAK9_9BURK|nr:MBL fold metallo-hydrolase [Paraburkholderia fungorum]AJZ56400.1 metallo-beta-lactamase superfamily protein [Paraburkholderia fungorum]MBB5545089.1 glyoxylase-like metal-dependent hydrolase (beta-lactamase superfamily II) [Paraburkholderia fungorum]MBU7442460.1 MBL fold metallo-hydrolase [Paraburkholderia fungorum]MDE1007253.1 MBL fold metallo-hydrolase [Paraburkholderia fungorum]MDT8840063.1 MBL fold metallo-hydrolase [Paraburkholderia fungorum]